MKPFRYALSLALAYGLIASLYIYFSSSLAAQAALDIHDLERIERLKGFAFVTVTTLLFYAIAWIIFVRFKRVTEEREYLRQATLMAQGRVLAGELAAVVAHDFNNALTVVQCAIYEAQETPDSRMNDSILHEASEAVRRAKELAIHLAQTARGQKILRAEWRELAPIIKTAVRSLAKLPRLSGCTIELSLSADVFAEVDAILFEQMLANLILNAADATGKNGLIRVVLTQENGKARLEVHDNGPGVPPEKRENIFKAFETTKPDGLGLGLLSVRIAVQVQGGELAITDSPLKGAAFLVTFPAGSGGTYPV